METRQRLGLVTVTAGLVVAAGVAVALMRFFGEVPPARNDGAAVGALALGAVIAAPGILAALSLPDRPALLLPAAIVLVPLSFISFALVTLPLLIPAFLLARMFVRTTTPGVGLLRVATVTLVVLALLITALLVLFIDQDPRQFRTATAFYSTSDVISYWEAARSLTLSALAVWFGWRFSPQAAPHPTTDRPCLRHGQVGGRRA